MKNSLVILRRLLALLLTVSTAFAAEEADVVVVAATPAGVAAAVAAARSGASVIVLEESNHVGGIVSAGLTNTDIHKKGAVGGLFAEFVRRVREHYAKTYGEESAQVKACQGGHMFEPKVAEQVFRGLLTAEKNVRLILRHRVVSARVVGADGVERAAERGQRRDGPPPQDFGPTATLVAIAADDLERPGSRVEFRAKAFVDATYEGDLAALSGVPYRVGRESRQTFGEAHAGRMWAKTAIDARAPLRRVDIPAVQRKILERGGVILYESRPLVPPEL